MNEMTITYRGTVYPWQCDHMGHMNVMWYVGKFDEATWQLLSTLGLTRSRFREQGVGMAAVEQRIKYKRELHAGDIITVRSGILEVKDKALHLLHEMINDETREIAATTVAIGVCIDANLRKARSLPTDVHELALKKIIGNESAGSEISQCAQCLNGYNLHYHGETEDTEARILHAI
jgi:acyl-CoA thioester hydrolase